MRRVYITTRDYAGCKDVGTGGGRGAARSRVSRLYFTSAFFIGGCCIYLFSMYTYI